VPNYDFSARKELDFKGHVYQKKRQTKSHVMRVSNIGLKQWFESGEVLFQPLMKKTEG
jgi:hypothetical protein